MKTPAPQRAAGRKKLAAAGQALSDGTAPIPDVAYLKKAIRAKGRVDPAKWPALKALIVKRAKALGATSAPGVKGTWAFTAANDTAAVELVGPKGYTHGWIKVGDDIEQTASKIVAGDDAGNRAGFRSDRVVRSLQIAAKAARDGDHATALTMLGKARNDTVGVGSQRVPAVKVRDEGSAVTAIDQHIKAVTAAMSRGSATPGVKKISAAESRRRRAAATVAAANDTGALEMAMATPRRMPVIRGAADVQLSRTGPGQITAMHKSTGMKVGMITPSGKGYAGKHADGTATPASGGQQGALAGLIAYHNAQAAKAKAGAAAARAKTYTAPETDAVDLAGALPVSTPAASASDGPRVTSMGSGKTSAAPAGSPSGLSPYAAAIYKKFIAKGMKPAVALAFAKRADAMHAKAAGPKASAA